MAGGWTSSSPYNSVILALQSDSPVLSEVSELVGCLQVFTTTAAVFFPYLEFILSQTRATLGTFCHRILPTRPVLCSWCLDLFADGVWPISSAERGTVLLGLLMNLLFTVMQIPYCTTALLILA